MGKIRYMRVIGKKSLALVLAAGFLQLNAQTAKEVESETKEVTVYLRGVKEKRNASVQVNAGEQQLLFTNLPLNLDPNTLRLGASDFIQIVSINHRTNYIGFDPTLDPDMRQLKDSLDHYTDQLKLKEGVYTSLQNTKQMILANKSVKGETHGMEAEDVVDLLDFYREKLNEINTKMLTLEKQLEGLREHQGRFSREYNQSLQGKAKWFSELTVTVRARQNGKATFSIEYFTNDAGWTPHYDIRNNGNNGKLEITSHAKIWQTTGYTWKNVELTLSTLNPQFDIEAPQLQAKVLDLNPVYNTRSYDELDGNLRMDGYGIVADSIRYNTSDRKVIRGGSYKDMDYFLKTTTSERGPGTEYKIAAPYTITSDVKQTSIEISRKNVSATFKYKTVPKVEKAVFLMAIVTGWDTLNFYPGNANIFNNGTFVGMMYLNTQSVEDSLQLSLGQDKSFSVEYEVNPAKTLSSTSGSSTKRSKGYIIRIMNKKDTPVTVEIVDQVPISSNQELSVDIDKNDGDLNPVTGMLTWRKTITPGQKIEVPVSYTVKFPKDHNLYNF